MAKSLFNFYLDDIDKTLAEEKLESLFGQQSKGQLAALLRVLLKDFIATPDIVLHKNNLASKINEEFVYSQKKNKRSKL